ncbi:hypothetical protein F3Y22_tig00117056pilonHSYRG00763 [Hibiscus syriacus]|uniref:Uncharacterized protein n=1 Tax=Hibiscus syriacus TaxID=106335 RepID=A0A6A2WWA1_HIBSY|nr:hypothetical protein F3Y22_tig00117056pilonHSYRG00763 [Hibiscus syriacus]
MSLPDRVTSVVDQIALHSNQTSFNDNHKIEYGAGDSVSSNTNDAEPNPKHGWPLSALQLPLLLILVYQNRIYKDVIANG